MSVRELARRPGPMAHFPDSGPYRWLELSGKGTVYGHAAIAERDDILELHLSLIGWGPDVRRSLALDLQWLKEEARRCGKKRIMGVRIDGRGQFDDRLFRFAHLYGFTDTCVLQTASLDLDAE